MASFGDRVRIKSTVETESVGIAGVEGDVFGVTTPSATGVTVIGGSPDDVALHVYFEGRSDELWFRPDLVETTHVNEGSVLEVGSVRATRQADGFWLEEQRRESGFLSRLLAKLRPH